MSHKKIIRCESDKGEYVDARVGVNILYEYLRFCQLLVRDTVAFSSQCG